MYVNITHKDNLNIRMYFIFLGIHLRNVKEKASDRATDVVFKSNNHSKFICLYKVFSIKQECKRLVYNFVRCIYLLQIHLHHSSIHNIRRLLRFTLK